MEKSRKGPRIYQALLDKDLVAAQGLNPEDVLPDPSVLSRFRTQHIAKTEESVQQILDAIARQCVERGLIKQKRLIADATHIVADTRLHRKSGSAACNVPVTVLSCASTSKP